MKKGTKLVALLLGLALVAPACNQKPSTSQSTEPTTTSEAPVDYRVTISNKEELQAEWFVGDQSRKVNIEIEPKANIAQLVNEGKITITSSDTAKLTIAGQMATPVAAGEATITVKCGESQDTVKVTLQAKQTVKEKYGVAHEGNAEDPFTNEDALTVAKSDKYNNEDFYVKGEVASWYHTPGERTDGYVSFFLKPAQAGGEQFEIYKCLKEDGKTALTAQEIWKGGIVTAHGTFTKYNEQYETTSAKFVKCEGTAPGARQEINATVAEVLAKGKTLLDGDSEYDYYNVTGYVVKKSGDNYFLADTKAAADKDTDMFEIYSAKAEGLADKLTKNAKITIKAVIKNYHDQVETCLPVAAADVTVIEAGEPWVINYQEKTVAEALTVVNALEDGKTAEGYYAVTGVVVAVTGAYSDQYKNMSFTMGDAATDTNLLTVFRLKTDADTAAKVVAGAKVIVKGQLQKYKDSKTGNITPELINASTIEIVPDAANTTKVTLNLKEYATAQSIATGTKVESIALDTVVTAKATGTDANTGKVYVGNDYTEWRFYKSGTGTLEIELAAGYTLVSAKGQIGTANWGEPSEVVFEVANNKVAYNPGANFNVKSLEVVYASDEAPDATVVKEWTSADVKTGHSNANISAVKDETGDVQFEVYKLGNTNETVTFKYTPTEAGKVQFNLRFTTKYSNASSAYFWKKGATSTEDKMQVSVNGTALTAPAENPNFATIAGENLVESEAADNGKLANPVFYELCEVDAVANQELTIVVKYLGGGNSFYIAGATLTK